MRDLGFDLWLDEKTGQAYLADGDTGELKATGRTFEVTPVYPWPMSVIWNKNAGQFATAALANALAVDLNKKIKGVYFSVDSEPEVKTGPFTWQKVRSILIRDPEGKIGELNAGLVAQYFIRNHANTAVKLVRGDIDRLKLKRDKGLFEE